jgi:large subunit ribosomal protein L30
MSESLIEVTYAKSAIGYSKRQKETVRSLGLRRLGDTVIQASTAPVLGMIASVQHLVTVRQVNDADVAGITAGAHGGETE